MFSDLPLIKLYQIDPYSCINLLRKLCFALWVTQFLLLELNKKYACLNLRIATTMFLVTTEVHGLRSKFEAS